MATILESGRTELEELELIEAAIAERIKRNPALYVGSTASSSGILGGKKRSYKETLLQQHEIHHFLNQYKKNCESLKEYIQNNAVMTQEIELLDDPTFQFTKFDGLLAQIKSRHESSSASSVYDISKIYAMYGSDTSELEESQSIQSHLPPKPISAEDTRLTKKQKKNILSSFASNIDFDSIFSDEELLGKYLDLITFHERYLNLTDSEKIPYIEYLDSFALFPYNHVKKNDVYLSYIEDLKDYLTKFLFKSQPLSNPEKTIKKIEADFETTWKSRQKERITEGDGIFCNACDKMFAKQTVFDGHLNGKKHKKALEKLQTSTTDSENHTQASSRDKIIASHEFKIKNLSELLDKQRQNTKSNTERRQALTDRERMLEIKALNEDSEESQSDEDSDNDEFSNPLKLPIGFDGKPIPFWLFKLHGLGVEYNCEICGNVLYKGRKSFEKHFVEASHIHGLKCLGITPGSTFKGITKIQDATQLWEKLRRERRREEGDRENAVEVEDEEGNVMSAKVYNDLKKQGLI